MSGDSAVSGGTWTGDDRAHNHACHKRWSQVQNRSTRRSDYRDDWYDEQCGGCRYWVALSGELGRDWGVCTRAASEFDGRVRFEHDGCDLFVVREDGSFG
ncbi:MULTISPECIES: DUF3027 domain-containing protein [unclassified Streptomyces]|uniref:DUF3027 domain-containing protein n=1 Tax=unclassified Streptomyces TaxID=2593676 RepID=UPI00381F5C7D